MGNKIVIILLLILLIALGIFTYYIYSQGKKCETLAKECANGVEICQAALTNLAKIPGCVPYIPTE